jgi:hypothetical protein
MCKRHPEGVKLAPGNLAGQYTENDSKLELVEISAFQPSRNVKTTLTWLDGQGMGLVPCLEWFMPASRVSSGVSNRLDRVRSSVTYTGEQECLTWGRPGNPVYLG